MLNVTAMRGDTVEFKCKVQDVGKHTVPLHSPLSFKYLYQQIICSDIGRLLPRRDPTSPYSI